jgi:hypothetical protein
MEYWLFAGALTIFGFLTYSKSFTIVLRFICFGIGFDPAQNGKQKKTGPWCFLQPSLIVFAVVLAVRQGRMRPSIS